MGASSKPRVFARAGHERREEARAPNSEGKSRRLGPTLGRSAKPMQIRSLRS